ncbi:MAG TPA: hypothetical protein VGR21_00075 [Cryptosporangiaceae bacterium]|nr:hypothetical protein [Cryptosporangiaceae bacterium]
MRIDVDAMSHAVTQLDHAAEALNRAHGELADALASVHLAGLRDYRVERAAAWIAGLRPDLLRRINAAKEANAPLRSGVFTADAANAPSWAVVTPPSALTAVDGRRAGEQVVRAMDGKAPPSTVQDGVAQVRVVTGKARRGERLTAGEIDFLRAFYAELGARVLQVPTYVRQASIRKPGTERAPAFSMAMQNAMLATFGDGLLALSDEKNPGGGWNAIPATTRETLDKAMADRPRTEAGKPIRYATELKLTGGESFRALSALLVHSTVRGGVVFSKSLQVAAVQFASVADALRRRLAKLRPWVIVTSGEDPLGRSHGDSKAVADRYLGKTQPSPLLRVGARNRAASLQNLTGPDRRSFIRGLVDHDWDDDGRSAGAVVSWLGKASVLGDAAAGVTPRQAQLGYFRLVEELTEPGDEKGKGNFYATATRSMQQNPSLSHGFAVATKGNIGLFAVPSDDESAWNAERGSHLHFRDARRVLMLSQYTAAGRAEIDVAREAYKQDLIHAARTGQPMPGEFELIDMNRAGWRAGNLDGLSIGAAENAIREKNRDNADKLNAELLGAYERRVQAATAVKNLVAGPASAIPTVGLLVSTVITTAGDAIILQDRGERVSPDLRPASLDSGSLQGPDTAVEIAAYDVAAYAANANEDIAPAARQAGPHDSPVLRVPDRSEVVAETRTKVVTWSMKSSYEQYVTAYQARANDTYVKFTTDDTESEVLRPDRKPPE